MNQAAVSINRSNPGEGESVIKLDIEWLDHRLKLEMTLADFAMTITGRGSSPATITRFRKPLNIGTVKPRDKWSVEPTAAPVQILDGFEYESRDVACARCGTKYRAAPWPKQEALCYRPRCSHCGSSYTYPLKAKP